ncbi:MAG: serine hydrolase domain-containing protein [Phycisphaerae bacterium]
MQAVLDILREGIERNDHLGAQVYVWHDGRVVTDAAVGQSRPGVPMTTDALLFWLSMGKPITAIGIAHLVGRGLLDLNKPVATYIPEFAVGGKEAITTRHLLSHTGGFRSVSSNFSAATYEEIIDRICNHPIEPDWEPGKRAGYHVASSWYVLGELIRRRSGRTVLNFIRETVFEPLNMRDCWLGMPAELFHRYGERIARFYLTDRPGEVPREHATANTEAYATLCRPGANARGPVNQLGLFYQWLLEERRKAPTTLAAEFTQRQRTGLRDETFGQEIDWGYGFLIQTGEHRYGYGPHASRDAFGHSGNQSSCAFADPAFDLVVAWATNGMCGETCHQQRQNAINAAIYEALDLD